MIIIKKKIVISVIIVVLAWVGISFSHFLRQDPLFIDGYTQYNNLENRVDIMLVNDGRHNIYIQEVLVNQKVPKKVQLVISYTGQMVAGGIDDEPLAKFININEAPIHPKISQEEFQAAVKTKTTPINYGIRIMNDEDIRVVRVKYKYMGFTFIGKVYPFGKPES